MSNKKIDLLNELLKLDNLYCFKDDTLKYHILFKDYHLVFTDTGIWLNGEHYHNFDSNLYNRVKREYYLVKNFKSDILKEMRKQKLDKVNNF